MAVLVREERKRARFEARIHARPLGAETRIAAAVQPTSAARDRQPPDRCDATLQLELQLDRVVADAERDDLRAAARNGDRAARLDGGDRAADGDVAVQR